MRGERRSLIFSTSVVLGCSVLLAGAAGGAVPGISPEEARTAAREGRAPSRRAAPQYAPGQLLVRFADSVLSPVEAVFDRRASFSAHTADRSSGLDELFRRFGVRGVHPVVREPVRGEGAVPSALDLRAADEAARGAQALRFAVRATRSPQAAVAPALHHLYRLDLAPGADVLAAAAAFASDPHVEFAEPNVVHEVAAAFPNDTLAADLWGLESIGWKEVWEKQAQLWPDAARRGGKGVVVAVLDSGVDVGHEDLAKNVWRDSAGRPGFDMVDVVTADYVADGWTLDPAEDYVKPDFNPADRNGHGTHVAGTIAAVANNRRGIAGVAWASKVMPARVGFQVLNGGSRYGLLETDDTIRALDRAVAAGADVVNMSFSGGLESQAFEAAIARARAAGVVLVAAAGNFNIDTRHMFPASYEGVVAVAAVERGGRRASFSNWGRSIDVVAPGVDVLSLRARDTVLTPFPQIVDEHYIYASGTSMASPHAAGAAALLISAFPRASTAEIVARLVAGGLSKPVEPVYDGRFHWALGSGLLDVPRSLTQRPGPAVFVAGHGVGQDASSDGAIDPGETGTLQIVLRNAWRRVPAVRIEVESFDPFATVTTGAQVKNLAQGGDLVVNFSFTAAAELRWGQPNRFHVTLDSASGGFRQDLLVELALRGPRRKQGWPALAVTEHDQGFTAPVLVDLDGDSHAEVVASTFYGDVLALRADGSPLPGWPVHLRRNNANGGLNAADLDGDSRPEVVFAQDRSLQVLGRDGALLPGWPVTFGSELRESPALGDLDGDGALEVVMVEEAGNIHVLDAGGRPRPGWPRPLGGESYSAPLLVDLDGGGLDVVISAYTSPGVFAFHADGSPVPGWPALGTFSIPRASATADLDGDGSPEIIALSHAGEVQVVDALGRLRFRTARLFDFAISSPAVGDLDGDGRPEIVVGGDFYSPQEGALFALSADGEVLPGWPLRTGSWVRTSPALADLDGDGAQEVIAGSSDGWLYALRADGTPVPGWPYFLQDAASDNLALGDLDGDGALDITMTLNRFFTTGLMPAVNVIEFGGVSPGAMPWPSGRGGQENPGAPTTP